MKPIIFSLPFILFFAINPAIYNLLINDDGPINILAMGQSNAIGRGVGGDFSKNNNVRVWNNENSTLSTSSIGDSFVLPNINNPPFVNKANNMFIHAANHISRVTGLEVRLVIVAAGGARIESWVGENKPIYDRAKIIHGKSRVGEFDVFFWHQGEADSVCCHSKYRESWLSIKDSLYLDGLVGDNTKYVIGQISNNYPNQINEQIEELAGNKTEIARISNFPTFDGTHFTGDSLVLAGKVYAKSYLGMTKYKYFDPKEDDENTSIDLDI